VASRRFQAPAAILARLVGGRMHGSVCARRVEEYRALSPAPERLIRLSDIPSTG